MLRHFVADPIVRIRSNSCYDNPFQQIECWVPTEFPASYAASSSADGRRDGVACCKASSQSLYCRRCSGNIGHTSTGLWPMGVKCNAGKTNCLDTSLSLGNKARDVSSFRLPELLGLLQQIHLLQFALPSRLIQLVSMGSVRSVLATQKFDPGFHNWRSHLVTILDCDLSGQVALHQLMITLQFGHNWPLSAATCGN